MFFQLAQIEKLSKQTDDLETAHQKLNTFIIDAYQSQPKVKNSLSSTISDILSVGQQKSDLFKKIEDDAMHGYLIPSFIDFDRFTQDRGDLPEWTRVVFEKEFEKQKQSLDVMAKKIYSSHALTEAKDKHERQLNSFKVLSDRYRVLSEYDETIDIMNEAEKMRQITNATTQKFMAYLHVIASKLMAFIQEMSSKCQSFGNQLNSMATRSTNEFIQPERPPVLMEHYPQKAYYASSTKSTGQNWLTRANRTLDRTNFRGKNPQDYLLRQPRWLNTFSSDYYL